MLTLENQKHTPSLSLEVPVILLLCSEYACLGGSDEGKM